MASVINWNVSLVYVPVAEMANTKSNLGTFSGRSKG